MKINWEAKQSKLQIPGLLLLGLFLLVICAAATQYIAREFNYHPSLGEPVFWKVYQPWAWLVWQARHYDAARALFNITYVLFLSAIVMALVLYVLAVGFYTRRSKRHEGVHGTAHWADSEEVQKTGLLSDGKQGAGVYVGGWNDENGCLHYLRHDGPEHIAAIAPTRSGKGVGLVVPTLLSWPHSVIVNDMKAELWAMTSGWRKKYAGNVVLKFDPAAAEGSVSFNPLEEVRVGSLNEVGDVQNLVTIIVDPDGKGLVDHWAKTAHAFLTGVILHLLYLSRQQGTTATLEKLAMALSDPTRPIDCLYDEMLKNCHQDGKQHPVIAAASRDMLNRGEEERGSVLSAAMSYLSLYRDPLVAKNTSRSDFKISDLMNHKKPVSLYLVIRPGDKDRLKPLLRLIINQMVRVLVRDEMQFKDGQALPLHLHRLLLMLDEFPVFGRLEILQEALAYIAGYGIKAYLIMQDAAQLWSAYGRDESIISNCHVRVAYAPNKIETAKWLSETLGTTTVVKEDISTSGQRFGAVLQHVSRTFHEVSRPLLTADECMRLKSPTKNKEGTCITEPGDVLVFVAGQTPIYGTQSLYFRDPIFAERVKIEAPPTDRIYTTEATEEIEPFVL